MRFGVAMLVPLFLLAVNARDSGAAGVFATRRCSLAPAVSVWLSTRRFRRELRYATAFCW